MRRKMQDPKPEKFLLKVFYKNGEVKRIQRKKKRRFSAIIQGVNDSGVQKYYIKVTYSHMIDSNNKSIAPINDGEYFNKKNLYQALGSFTEK